MMDYDIAEFKMLKPPIGVNGLIEQSIIKGSQHVL
jgi:hypothetical protein